MDSNETRKFLTFSVFMSSVFEMFISSDRNYLTSKMSLLLKVQSFSLEKAADVACLNKLWGLYIYKLIFFPSRDLKDLCTAPFQELVTKGDTQRVKNLPFRTPIEGLCVELKKLLQWLRFHAGHSLS